VRFFAERPGRWLYSTAKKFPAGVRRRVYDGYLRGILRQARGERFDRVVLIRGEIVQPWFVQALRESQPQACRFVMYQWDSLRVVNFSALLPLFDATASFDSVDAETLGLRYLPLFHMPQYTLDNDGSGASHDLAFVGSYHAARYETLLQIRAACQFAGVRLRHYLYISPVDYYKLKLLRANVPARADVEFAKLDSAAILAIYRDTASILDIENTKQAGLTMRTFEALATGRNLVTTNAFAAKLLPELSDRIIVIDREQLALSRDRLRAVPGPSAELDKYSLKHWAGVLLGM
jgi:hypothetical protein